LAALGGCACTNGGGPAELAGLESLGPLEVEPGEQVDLTGSGFVVGPARLYLVGILSAPGQAVPRRPVRIALDALATSPSRASTRLGRRHFDRFGAQHCTFTGRAELSFPSGAGPAAPAVTASLDGVRLDLFASPTAHEAVTRQARTEGRALLERVGLRGSVLPEGRGLAVEGVESGSLADRAGMRRGDAVVTAGALTVAGIADLAPPPRSRNLVLGVRDAEGAMRRIAFPLDRDESAPDTDRLAAMSIAAAALLLLLVAAGPLRGPARLLGNSLARAGDGPRALLRQVAGSGAAGPGTAAFALLLFAGAPFAVMAMSWTSVVVVTGIVCLVSIATAAWSASGWRRIWAAVVGAVRTLPLAMGAAVVAVRAASMDLDQIISSQGHMPWHWEALASPTSLGLFVVTMAVTASAEGRATGPASAALRGMAGALVAAIFLGGWAAPQEHLLVGQIAFAAKGWAVGLCFPVAARTRWIVALPTAALLAAGSIAARVLTVPGWIDIAAPWSAAAAFALLVLPLGIWWLVTTSVSRGTDREANWVTEDPVVAPTQALIGQNEVMKDPGPQQATAEA